MREMPLVLLAILAIPACDVLRINGIAPGEEVVVMMDARTSAGCEDGGPGHLKERIFTSRGTTFLRNMLSPDACNSEIAVFSRDHAMALQPATWTDGLWDEQVVRLRPRVDIDVNVWVIDDAAYARADAETKRATALYIDNRVGVNLRPRIRKLSESTTANPLSVVNAGTNAFGTQCYVTQLRATDLYTANTVNVYYVDKNFRGRNCAIQSVPNVCTSNATQWPAADANIIFIGNQGSSTTLAHEIGHAFGLRPAICGGHTDQLPGFGPENIMQAGGGDERTKFTLGQVFRMNTHADGWGGTVLITDGDPARARRSCAPNYSDARCPALTADP
jgi:hypothetical protein